jgi:hypothetical protein
MRMRMSVLAAALAVTALSGAALAEEATPSSGPAEMTNSELDGVTAAGQPTTEGQGLTTAGQASDGREQGRAVYPHGQGVCTTGASGRC